MMWPYYYDGWNWLWMVGMMVVFWGAVIVLAAWVIRSMGRSNDNDAMAILHKRLAAGEISRSLGWNDGRIVHEERSPSKE